METIWVATEKPEANTPRKVVLAALRPENVLTERMVGTRSLELS